MRTLLMKALATGAVFCAVATAAQAAAPPRSTAPASNRQCFHASTVNSFRAPKNDTVYVRVGVRDVYKLDLMGSCPDVNWAETIGLRSRGSEWVCDGIDVDLIVRRSGGIGPNHCPVSALHKLTPEEVKALPRGSKP
jgi:hypothetical protein